MLFLKCMQSLIMLNQINNYYWNYKTFSLAVEVTVKGDKTQYSQHGPDHYAAKILVCLLLFTRLRFLGLCGTSLLYIYMTLWVSLRGVDSLHLYLNYTFKIVRVFFFFQIHVYNMFKSDHSHGYDLQLTMHVSNQTCSISFVYVGGSWIGGWVVFCD
jgi:hypothetical protein